VWIFRADQHGQSGVDLLELKPVDVAEELEVQVMATHKKKLRADHPDTWTSINNLTFT
jgi:hypothetical protein